jgi:hypothetical protein
MEAMKKLLLTAAGLAGLSALAGLLSAGVGMAQTPGTPPTQSIVIPVGQGQRPDSFLPTTPGYNEIPTSQSDFSKRPTSGFESRGPSTADVDKYFSGNESGLKTTHAARAYVTESLEQFAMNNDIAVQPNIGPWMIYVTSYSGKDAPVLAREMVKTLRENPKYKLPAFVFTKGEKERRDELKKISEYIEYTLNAWKQQNLPLDTPIRIPVTRYEIQCAVLVGGFPTMDAARDALDRLKKLDPSGLPKTALHAERVVDTLKQVPNAKGPDLHYVLVNPFTTSMVVRNPSSANDQAAEKKAEWLAFLRTMNADEEYSLLKNPHKYTLAIKEFVTPRTDVKSKGSSGGFLDKLCFWESNDHQDIAYINAHNMADTLRKAKLKIDAYVLHDRYSSMVFVGGYDSVDDPQLKHDQETLPQINNWQTGQLRETLRILNHPLVYEVPH